MKTSWLPPLALWGAVAIQGLAGAASPPAMERLDLERAAAEKAVNEDFEERRRVMLESEAWSMSTEEEREQRLRALREEFQDHERRLKQEYKMRREEIKKEAI